MTQPTRTLLTSSSSGSGTTAVTASISPTTNKLIIATVSCRTNDATPDRIAASGNGLTWVRMAETIYSDGDRRHAEYRALGTASPGAVTFTWSGPGTPDGWSWVINEWSNTPITGTSGSDAVGPVDADEGSETPAPFTVPGTPSTDDVTVASMGNMDDVGTVTIPSGFASAGNATGGETSTYVSYDVDRLTSGNYTWTTPPGGRAWATHGYIVKGVTADVTANLSGQSSTSSAGTIAPARAVTASGQAATLSQGSVSKSVSIALSGLSSTASRGTIAPALTIALTGSSLTASQGAISAGGDVTVSLSGLSMTSAAGTIASAIAAVLAGNTVTITGGSLAPARSVGATGQAATSAAGTISPARTVPITGSAATTAQGFIASSGFPITIVGTPDPTSAYRITASPDIVSGDWIQAAGDATGTTPIPAGLVIETDATWQFTSGNYPAPFWVRISNDGGATWGAWAEQSIGVTTSITGQSATAAPGSVAKSSAAALSGGSMTASQGSALAAIAKTLSGQGLALSQGTITASSGVTVALTGQSVAASTGSVARSAALSLVGSALSMGQGIITTGNDVVVSLTGQALTAALGTLSAAHASALTGSASTASAGSVSTSRAAGISGQAATLSAGTLAMVRACSILGIPCAVSQGTVSVNGSNVTVDLVGAEMTSEAGDVTVSNSGDVTVSLTGVALALLTGDLYALTPPISGGAVPYPSIEGAPASPNPIFCVDNPEPGTPVAGENGCIVARFARCDAQGQVWNGRRAADEILGFVQAVPAVWGRVYWSYGRAVLRPGLPVAIMASGDFWCRFDGGAYPGARVHASLVDGAAVSGYAAGCEPTPWYVVTSAAPGELAIISTTSRVQ